MSSFGLGTMLVANSVLGPLAAGVIHYRMSGTLINQLIALDVVTLAVIAPLCVLAGALVLRGHRAGPVLVAAPAAFTTYLIAQTVVGSDYLGVAGNNERWFPWHLGLFVLAAGTLAAAWSRIDGHRLPAARPRRDRRTAFGLLAIALFVGFGQWLPALADMMRDRPTGAGYLDNPAMTWTLALLDLGLATPAAVAVAVGLWRGAGWARRAAYPVAGFFALVGPAVAAMAMAMHVRHDPNASTAGAVLLCVVALLLAAFGLAVHRPLLAGPDGTLVPADPRPPVLTSAVSPP